MHSVSDVSAQSNWTKPRRAFSDPVPDVVPLGPEWVQRCCFTPNPPKRWYYIPSVDSGLDVVRLPFGYGREWYHWIR